MPKSLLSSNVRRNGKFHLGGLVMTPGVHNLMMTQDLNPMYYVGRHLLGDWGDIPDEDKLSNEEYLVKGGRLFSAYDVPDPVARIWVITEADRSSTTVLLPSEY